MRPHVIDGQTTVTDAGKLLGVSNDAYLSDNAGLCINDPLILHGNAREDDQVARAIES